MVLRPLLLLTFSGLLLLPDWSDARPFRTRRLTAAPVCPPMYCSTPVPAIFQPAYSAPIVAYAPAVCPPIAYAPVVVSPALSMAPCPPMLPMTNGPKVVPERMQPKATQLEPRAGTGSAAIRSAGGEERLPPVPVPMSPVELAMPRSVSGESQKPEVKPYPLNDLPPLGLDQFGSEPAKPRPPAKAPELPAFPADALSKPKEAKPDDALPKFDEPPPLLPLPTTSKSSPLNAEASADVYPLAGSAPVGKTRIVGFINKSGRAVRLTVGGKPTTLANGDYLRVELPAAFRWSLDGGAERETVVPAAAPGIDVVIRK